ncbi:hypothetical protein HJC23_001185 [Cyclotella cryptica]|uniref:PABS domain-containing protein n=1 Tax=Cyclotella cryptica TaxID=29204 RepID=A0ABD3QMY0_9STRA|eukprot:CCRYP_003809-RA/>CCRYP_003809-RA protein AED:0.28 eAED:0.28 QI:801/1/1/1/0.66/0.5/4/2981/876
MARRSNASGNANGHHHKPSSTLDECGTGNRFSIRITFLFTIVSLSLSFVVALSVGCISRVVLLSSAGALPSPTRPAAADAFASDAVAKYEPPPLEQARTMSGKTANQLPSPKVLAGKDVPYTTYTSKTFHTAATVTANTLHIDRTTAMLLMTGKTSKGGDDGGPDLSAPQTSGKLRDAEGEWIPCHESPNPQCSRGKAAIDHVNTAGHNSDANEEHLPAGQHLLIDLKDVSSSFLNSESRLAEAMISLINESRLTLLSYHCHSLVPIGVSCAGVLLESHVAFHTWPAEGVITLDLFTCGGMPLIPVLPLVERLFGVEREEDEVEEGEVGVKPSMLWAHKLRGFREGFAEGYDPSDNPLDGEMERFLLGKMDYDLKRPLVSTHTDFQSFEVYEVLPSAKRSLTSYQKSLDTENETYESANPELFVPDKLLYLGGVMQSTLYGEAIYHESIVHPPLITHENPKRVAIVGGGEGATLREVLKHRSVESAVMIEIDGEVVELSREYLKEWSDCSDIEGSNVEWCIDDERVEARYEDALGYFKTKYGRFTTGVVEKDRFDVVIMDALDPNEVPEIAEELYQSDNFIGSLYSSLTEHGILSVQLGESPWFASAPDEVGAFTNRAIMIQKMRDVGFKSIHIYEESHSGFLSPWSTLLAFKDYDSRANWYRSAAEIDLELQRRILPMKSGRRPLLNYDGATHFSYQLPTKPFETIYCRALDGSNKCGNYGGFSPVNRNVPVSDLEIKEGRGVFTKTDIAKHSWIGLDEQVKSFVTRPSTWSVADSLNRESTRSIISYLEDYGVCNIFLGQTHCCAVPRIFQFMNSDTESFNFGDWTSQREKKRTIYSPVIDRHIRQVLKASKMTLKDISEGEEIIISSSQVSSI